ncbi:MAG: SRPBCC domain-containing protein [bacterium]
MASNQTPSQLANPERFNLDIARTFDAPPELVFEVWTDPVHVAKWWGPHHFTVSHCQLDVRPGGAILIHMRGPDGTIFPMGGLYEVVDPPHKLVILQSVSLDDETGSGFHVRTSVTFTELDGKTLLTVEGRVVQATPDSEGPLSGMAQGWDEQLQRLGAYLSGAMK